MSDPRYYTDLIAAFVRGRLGARDMNPDELIEFGRQQGLRLHRFKQTGLPRVIQVIGILKGLMPSNLLDIGSGRGTFLWPLVDALPHLKVTAIDVSERRVADINAVRQGGVERVRAFRESVMELSFPDNCFDTVTALEVLEHLEEPLKACRQILRVARRFVVASVPSKPDTNPEHIQFFTSDAFETLFLNAGGAKSVKLSYVLNHTIAVVKA